MTADPTPPCASCGSEPGTPCHAECPVSRATLNDTTRAAIAMSVRDAMAVPDVAVTVGDVHVEGSRVLVDVTVTMPFSQTWSDTWEDHYASLLGHYPGHDPVCEQRSTPFGMATCGCGPKSGEHRASSDAAEALDRVRDALGNDSACDRCKGPIGGDDVCVVEAAAGTRVVVTCPGCGIEAWGFPLDATKVGP